MNIDIAMLRQKVIELECKELELKRKLENYRAISAALVVCVLLLLIVKAA